MKRRRIPKFSKSLMSRYVLIILVALLFVPVLVPASFVGSWLIDSLVLSGSRGHQESTPYSNGTTLSAAWHKEALLLKGKSEIEIAARLKELKQRYPDASLFRVTHEGRTTLELPEQTHLPDQWSTEQMVQFMKNSQSGEPFTVVAFIGDRAEAGQGFMVFQLPRHFVRDAGGKSLDGRIYGTLLFLLFLFFIAISYWFIRGIRRRLLQLSSAMENPSTNGIPRPIKVGWPDEIGGLEEAFNGMIYELELSRLREREEENLRKSLISNLSHDLRTPLTIVNSHLYSLKGEPLTAQGHHAVKLMETKVQDLDHLIEHLLSYNLLTSGKYQMDLKRQDVLRLARESAAAWYPVWEKEGLKADVELDHPPLLWQVDGQAFRRVLDNLFQNVLRHAAGGAYIGLSVQERSGRTALAIHDHGPGIEAQSARKGAGLGLAIVDLLLKEMGLVRETDTGPRGTCIWIYPGPGERR